MHRLLQLLVLFITAMLVLIYIPSYPKTSVFGQRDYTSNSIPLVSLYSSQEPFSFYVGNAIALDYDTMSTSIVFAYRDGRYWNLSTFYIEPVDVDRDESIDAFRKATIKVEDLGEEARDIRVLGYAMKSGYVAILVSYLARGGEVTILQIKVVDRFGKTVFSELKELKELRNPRGCVCALKQSDDFLVVYTSAIHEIRGFFIYRDGERWRKTNEFIVFSDPGKEVDVSNIGCIGGVSNAIAMFVARDGEAYIAYVAYVERVDGEGKVNVHQIDAFKEPVTVYVNAIAYSDSARLYAFALKVGRELRFYIYEESGGKRCSKELTDSGAEPYVIGLSDRFVVGWIDYFRDNDGDPRIANVDFTCYIQPRYGKELEEDTLEDHNPMIVYQGGNSVIYVHEKLVGYFEPYYKRWNVELVYVDIGSDPRDEPSPVGRETIARDIYTDYDSHPLHGIAYLPRIDMLSVFLIDRDLYREDAEYQYIYHAFLYVSIPHPLTDIESIEILFLPEDRDRFLKLFKELVDRFDRVYVAVAYFQDEKPCASGISEILASAAKEGKDVVVVIDDDPRNKEVAECLSHHHAKVIEISGNERHIMHHKFAVFGDRQDRFYDVIVSTANFIEEDLGVSYNVVLYLRNAPAIAYFFAREIEEFINGRYSIDKNDWSFFTSVNYRGEPHLIEGYFSPSSGALHKLPYVATYYVWNVERSLKATSYIFTSSSTLRALRYGIIRALALPYIDIELVFDGSMNLDTLGRALYEFLSKVENAGDRISIVLPPKKMHAKVFVVDEVLLIGSWNPTKTASEVHDEYLMVLHIPSIASDVAKWIDRVFSENVRASKSWKPTYPYISAVSLFRDNEWVKICNPTSEDIDLSMYMIGDEGNIFGGDESMYRFPSNSRLRAGSCIVIALNAERFRERYGFYPDYEIVDSTDKVPDMVKMDSAFEGKWELNDDGDEVLLLYNENGFLKVVDAVWYKTSTDSREADYSKWSWYGIKAVDVTGIAEDEVLIRKGNEDAVYPGDVFVIERITNRAPIVKEANVSLLETDVIHIEEVKIVDPDGDRVDLRYVVVGGRKYEISSLPIDIEIGDLDYAEISIELVEHNAIKDVSYVLATGYTYKRISSNNVVIHTLINVSDFQVEFLPSEPAIRVTLTKASPVRVHLSISIPEGYEVDYVKAYIDGTEVDIEYEYDKAKHMLWARADPTIIWIQLIGPTQPQQPSAIGGGAGSALGGYAETMAMEVAILVAIAMIVIAILRKVR